MRDAQIRLSANGHFKKQDKLKFYDKETTSWSFKGRGWSKLETSFSKLQIIRGQSQGKFHRRKLTLRPRTIFNVFAIIGATFGFFAAAAGGAGTETDPEGPPWVEGFDDPEDGPGYFFGWKADDDDVEAMDEFKEEDEEANPVPFFSWARWTFLGAFVTPSTYASFVLRWLSLAWRSFENKKLP